MFEKKKPVPASGLEYVSSPQFQEDAVNRILQWDREWLRYFSFHELRWYFYSLHRPKYWLDFQKNEILKMTAEEIFAKPLREDRPADTKLGIWAPGSRLVDKIIVELGCGPGALGKLTGKFCKRYIGIDYSPLALSIAKLVSPSNCEYYCIDEVDRFSGLAGQVDTCVGRHFFIHQNFTNSVWVLSMFRDMIKQDGFISADFYSGKSLPKGSVVHPARSPLDKNHSSCMFYYTNEDIEDLADTTGLKYDIKTIINDPPRKFVYFYK